MTRLCPSRRSNTRLMSETKVSTISIPLNRRGNSIIVAKKKIFLITILKI